MGYETLVDFQHWTFVAQICNLLIQAYLFKRFLFQPIKKILAKRQEEVDALQKSTTQANEEAQLARTEYESHLAQAKQEAAELVRTATAHAQKRSDAIVQEAKEDLKAGDRMGSDHDPRLLTHMVPVSPVDGRGPIPAHMLNGKTLNCDVPKGTIITYDMVDEPEGSVLWDLRRRQDKME